MLRDKSTKIISELKNYFSRRLNFFQRKQAIFGIGHSTIGSSTT
jgi:hypothetical protein